MLQFIAGTQTYAFIEIFGLLHYCYKPEANAERFVERGKSDVTSTGSPCLTTIHLMTIQNYNSATKSDL